MPQGIDGEGARSRGGRASIVHFPERSAHAGIGVDAAHAGAFKPRKGGAGQEALAIPHGFEQRALARLIKLGEHIVKKQHGRLAFFLPEEGKLGELQRKRGRALLPL